MPINETVAVPDGVPEQDRWYVGDTERYYDENGVWRDDLPEAEHNTIRDRIFEKETKDCKSHTSPKAIFLAGQPGAGKSGMGNIAKKDLQNDFLCIDIDELRVYHPRYIEHTQHNAENGATSVQNDASSWGKELTKYARKNGFNIIIDGTLANAEKAVTKAKEFQAAGYTVEVYAVAVKDSLSQEGVRSRFERAGEEKRQYLAEAAKKEAEGDSATAEKLRKKAEETIPRNVEDPIQVEAYAGLPASLEALQQLTDDAGKPLVDIKVYDRYTNILATSPGPPTPSKALEDKRNAPLTEKEKEDYNTSCNETRLWMEHRLAQCENEIHTVPAVERPRKQAEIDKLRNDIVQEDVRRHDVLGEWLDHLVVVGAPQHV